MLKILGFFWLLFISMLSPHQVAKTLKGKTVFHALQQLKSRATISIDGPIKKKSISKDAESFRLTNLPLERYFD